MEKKGGSDLVINEPPKSDVEKKGVVLFRRLP